MTQRGVEAIVRALNAARVRYLIAGGLAVVAYGHLRYTADVDLILDLEPDNLGRAADALSGLGYVPRAPVPMTDFGDVTKRETWIRDKGMKVFSLFGRGDPMTEVDLFIELPFVFEEGWHRAREFEIAPGLQATFVGLDDLIEMKKRAGRPVDRDDLSRLEALKKDLER